MGAGPTVRNNGTAGRTRATGTALAAPHPGGAVGMYLTCDSVTDGRYDAPPDPGRRRSAGHHRRAATAAARRGLRGHAGALAGRSARARSRRRTSISRVLDLNYTRDTTSGQEGFDLMERIRVARSDAAGPGHDGVEQRRRRGRSDAARRARLHREAVGRRQAAGDGADADRAAARASRRSQRLQEANAAAAARRDAGRSSARRRRCRGPRRPSSGSRRRTRAC